MIVQKVQNAFGVSSVPDEETLMQFNNEPLDAVNDSLVIGSDKSVSVLFLGNSITYCDAAEEDEDKTKRGLASTSKERDYVHCLVRMIVENLKINVYYSIVNIADFERTYSRFDFNIERLDNVNNKKPEILIVQIGENVSKDVLIGNPEIYQEQLTRLLTFFPESSKILTLPFWQFDELNYLTTLVAIDNNAFLVDLSHLGNDKTNFASSQRKYENPGVGAHPGDKGMKNIAECLYTAIQLLIKDKHISTIKRKIT